MQVILGGEAAMIERHSTIYTVVAVEERFRSKHISGAGRDAIMGRESTGWWVVLNNLSSFYIGENDPKIPFGTKVTLALEINRD